MTPDEQAVAFAPLTPQERERLTNFKWRYVLQQVDGCTRAQADRLVFIKWLVVQGRVSA